MPQHPLFDINPEHILALDDEGLRILIARLCKADLRRRGLPISGVLYGGNQIAADGGIDVRVELPVDTEISGFIPRPATGFQAKADDMPSSEIAKEMRPPKSTQRLRPLMEIISIEIGVSEPQKARDSLLSAIERLTAGEGAWLPVRSWPISENIRFPTWH